jgi:hypothetical protein
MARYLSQHRFNDDGGGLGGLISSVFLIKTGQLHAIALAGAAGGDCRGKLTIRSSSTVN